MTKLRKRRIKKIFRFDIALKYYDLCNRYVFHSDTIKWTVFSIFAVLNGILIAELVRNDMLSFSFGKIVLSVFGLGTSIAWFLVNGRNQGYIEDRICRAKEVEKQFPSEFDKYKLWNNPTNRIERPYWHQNQSAEKINCALIIILFHWWLFYLFYLIIFSSGLVSTNNLMFKLLIVGMLVSLCLCLGYVKWIIGSKECEKSV